jgi:ADP-heptose:LPS heptosyltransferase
LIFPGALGDLLLALPTLRRLRRQFAGGSTTLVVAEPLRSLARLMGVAEHVASLDDASSAWLFGGSRLPAWLTGRPAVYAWLGSGDATLRARLDAVASPACLLAVERGSGVLHAAVAYAVAASVGALRSRLVADARLTPPDSAAARSLIGRLARPVLAIHRGAGAPSKRWSPDAFDAVADGWRRGRGDVVELLGPAETNDQPRAGVVPVRDWSLPDVAALLGSVAAYVGNDSGVSHLAGAVGARGVVVFAATDPRRWRPLSPAMVALGGSSGGLARAPRATRVLQILSRFESLTSSDPGSSVRA